MCSALTKEAPDASTPIEILNALTELMFNSSRLSWSIYEIFAEVCSVSMNIFLKTNSLNDLAGFEKDTRKTISEIFDTRFRNEDLVVMLSDVLESYSNLAGLTGFGEIYQYMSNLWAAWNNDFLEPIRDWLWRTPSYKVATLEKYSLFHYSPHKNKNDEPANSRTPLLIVYAFINRHYILDLLPEASVIRSLQSQGFDIYATDWGTPSAYDKNLTIGHFVNSYLDRSVDLIRETARTDRVNLLGYCWGGNLVLIYAALHPDKVKNVITVATPGDFCLDDTLLSVWTKAVKANALLKAFGNVPGMLLNAAFALRNPIELGHKYPHFFEQPHSLESIMEFLATEMWLYDSPPVIGEIYREFVRDGYQQNLFINNKMKVDGAVVNLKNMSAPFLNIIAEGDDLVAPSSSNALINVVGSADKNSIKFQSGHVGLIIGHRAHQQVWPRVGEWLKAR